MLANTGEKIVLLFLIAFLVVSNSYGLEACQCDKALINEFTFTNNKLTTQHYALQKGGSAGSWTTLTPMTFTLQPGGSKTIIAFTTIPCNAVLGVHNLEVMALSEDSSLKQSIDFTVNTCHNFEIKIDEDNICVDSEAAIPIMINNTGIYSEQINLSSNYNLSVNNVTIDAGSQAIVNVLIKPDYIGEFKLNIQASNNNKLVNETFIINSVACSFFDLDFSNEVIELCEDDSSNLNIRITNEAKTNRFHFLTDSDFITMTAETTLQPNQVYYLPLIVNSQCNSGIESTNITIYSEGSERYVIPLTIDFKSCYQPILMTSVNNQVSCACSTNYYDFILYNPGSKTVKYALTSSLGEVYYNNNKVDSVTLNPYSEALLKLKHQVPCDFSGVYNYTLTANSISVCSKSSSDTVISTVKSWADCEEVSLSGLTDYRITADQAVIPVNVKNVGNLATSYYIEVSGSAMSYLMGLSSSFITLLPGEEKTVELTMSPINETDAFLTVKALSADNLASSSLTIYFHTGLISYKGLYYLTIPSSIIVISSLLFYRKKRVLTKR